MKKLLQLLMLVFILVLKSFSGIGQEEKTWIHHGNKDYKNGKFSEAEKNYKKALEKNSNSLKGAFNMGDALYKQGKYAEAAGQFESITNRKTTSDTLSMAYHNLGNSLLRQKKYEDCVNAYKKALKNNPDDEDTRYNLAYALQMIKKQEQQQKQNQDNKNDKNEDKKEKQEQNQGQKKEEEQKEQQSQNKISPEDAKRLLDALNNDEKKTQEKLKKQQVKGEKSDIEKDW